MIEPFRIDIPDSAIHDLNQRLDRVRWPDHIEGSGWAYGTERAFLAELVDHWRHRFDWRRAEAALNQWPQFRTDIDGEALHFARVRGKGPAPAPLIVTHGWPSSIVEWSRIAPLLTDPGAHGGDPADAFDLIMPSLPGFGFSDIPARAGVSPPVIARRMLELMSRLGHDRFFAHGTDYGARITPYQALFAPERVMAWHTTLMPVRMFPPALQARLHADDDTPEGRERSARMAGWARNELAYTQIQGTKPQSLAYGLTDSPVGLAGWIIEKWHGWSDCGTDLLSRFSMDDLLTNIAIYWFTGTINSSMRLYYESDRDLLTLKDGERVLPPAGFALEAAANGRPRDLRDTPRMAAPPRDVCEEVFDIRRFTLMPAGGHFMALEEPAALAGEIAAFFRPFRAGLGQLSAGG